MIQGIGGEARDLGDEFTVEQLALIDFAFGAFAHGLIALRDPGGDDRCRGASY